MMTTEQPTKYRIFDCHFHVRGIFLPKENGSRMQLVKYLDRCGIDKAVVTTLNEDANMKNIVQSFIAGTSRQGIDPMTEGIKNTPLDHEPVRRLVKEHPDRFVGAYWFNPNDANQEKA